MIEFDLDFIPIRDVRKSRENREIKTKMITGNYDMIVVEIYNGELGMGPLMIVELLIPLFGSFKTIFKKDFNKSAKVFSIKNNFRDDIYIITSKSEKYINKKHIIAINKYNLKKLKNKNYTIYTNKEKLNFNFEAISRYGKDIYIFKNKNTFNILKNFRKKEKFDNISEELKLYSDIINL